VTRSGLLRLLLLGAAVICVLIGVRLLPAISTPDTLGPPSAVIVNDTAREVLVVHCGSSCTAKGGTRIAPAQQLPAGPMGARWQVEDSFGAPLGCLTVNSPGERLLVSRAIFCSPS
jgi:hypothetical protein